MTFAQCKVLTGYLCQETFQDNMQFTSSCNNVDTLDLNTTLDAKENTLYTQDLPLICSTA